MVTAVPEASSSVVFAEDDRARVDQALRACADTGREDVLKRFYLACWASITEWEDRVTLMLPPRDLTTPSEREHRARLVAGDLTPEQHARNGQGQLERHWPALTLREGGALARARFASWWAAEVWATHQDVARRQRVQPGYEPENQRCDCLSDHAEACRAEYRRQLMLLERLRALPPSLDPQRCPLCRGPLS